MRPGAGDGGKGQGPALPLQAHAAHTSSGVRLNRHEPVYYKVWFTEQENHLERVFLDSLRFRGDCDWGRTRNKR